jgi:hypothetical protein
MAMMAITVILSWIRRDDCRTTRIGRQQKIKSDNAVRIACVYPMPIPTDSFTHSPAIFFNQKVFPGTPHWNMSYQEYATVKAEKVTSVV